MKDWQQNIILLFETSGILVQPFKISRWILNIINISILVGSWLYASPIFALYYFLLAISVYYLCLFLLLGTRGAVNLFVKKVGAEKKFEYYKTFQACEKPHVLTISND